MKFALSLALAGSVMVLAGQAQAQTPGATLVCSKGSAEINTGKGWGKPTSSASLSAGDRVRVTPGSICEVRYASGGTTALAAGTTVAITTVPAAGAAGGAAAAGAGAGLGGLGAGTAFLPIVGGAVLAGGLAAVIAANDDSVSGR